MMLLIALLAFGFHTAFAECTSNLFAGGDGTVENPYQNTANNSGVIENLAWR
ncbi:hypothetical protein R83H12_01386 [Fibrobacteria bacterium R8-3-H12]